MDGEVWRCSRCGGTEIQERVQIWRDLNGDFQEDCGGDVMEYWCPNEECEGQDIRPIKGDGR